MKFKGTGYDEIEPLETSLKDQSMLGSIPVKLVAIEANDGKKTTPAGFPPPPPPPPEGRSVTLFKRSIISVQNGALYIVGQRL